MRFKGLVVPLLAVLLGALVVPVQASAATALPGGRAAYVVSLGKFESRESWVRLAQYQFTTSGTVSESFWYWSQAGPFSLSLPSSGVKIAGCDGCTVRTPVGFQNSADPKTKNGTYTLSSDGSTVDIAWAGGSTERWRVSNGATATRISLLSSNYDATNGWGWGSRARFASAVSTGQILARGNSFRGQFIEDNYSTVLHKGNTEVTTRLYEPCGTACLYAFTGAGTIDATQFYIGHMYDPSYPRKDTYQFAKTQVDPGREIQLGHINGLLQILDDNGDFRGWVGAQAAQYSRNAGANIVAIYELTDF